MNKKIIFIGIISMFLLTGLGLSTVSASNIQTSSGEIGYLAIQCTFFNLPRTTLEPYYILVYDENENLIQCDFTCPNVAYYPDIPVGTYTIKAQAGFFDEKTETVDVEEGDSDNNPTIVTINFGFKDSNEDETSKSKTINPILDNVLSRLLDNHPHMFPLLRVLLGL